MDLHTQLQNRRLESTCEIKPLISIQESDADG